MAATTSATSSSLALSGLASGIDWTSIVSEMMTAEAAPEIQMQTNITNDQNKNNAYQAIGSVLTNLSKDVATLSDPSFFATRTASLSNNSVATASAASGTALGSYNFTVSQLASDAVQQGSAASGKPLSSSNNVSTLVLSSAGFANPVTAGTFTVNGQAVNIAASDTLQSVFDKISTATGGAVTGSYNASTDEISLAGTSPIVLGSATDTSNFLQSAELYNNGGNTITSVSALGGVNLSNPMDNANLSTTISDGGSGAGQFTINGVAINFDASTDSVNDVLQSINDSSAGVTATYDSLNDRFELTDKTPGDVGISLQDVTGNFLAATGLSTGALQRGNNLLYNINNGGTLTSQSNTIDGNTSGVTGLSITALSVGSTTVSVNSDTSTISSAISSFVTDYNAAQNYISGQTATSTDTQGNVTPGTLTGDMDAEGIMTGLRQAIDTSPAGLSGGINGLNDLGIATNGSDNTLALNAATLTTALTTNLSAVEDLFTNPTNGVAATLGAYINDVNGSNGVLSNDETNMTNEVTTLNKSIATLQEKITNDTTSLDSEFTNMETSINSLNSEKQYLNDYFNSSSASSNTAPTAAGSG